MVRQQLIRARRQSIGTAWAILPLALSLPIAISASVQAEDVPQNSGQQSQNNGQQNSGIEVRVQKPANNETISARSFDLDIFYKNQNENVKINAAELWVDNVRWVRRDLDTPAYKGILSFDVETVDLVAGAHNIIVKLFAEDGTVSSAPLSIRMSEAAVVSNATEQGGPDIAFRNLTQGKKLSGTVEIGMNVKGNGISNPFVSFYVDDKFKTLKNFPPYSFLWDTTGVENGYHTIDAVAYQESTQSTTKRRIGIYVDNVGGATKRTSEVADLNVKRAQEKHQELLNAPTARVQGNAEIPLAIKAAVKTSVSTNVAKTAKTLSKTIKAATLTPITVNKATVQSVGTLKTTTALRPIVTPAPVIATVKPSIKMVAPTTPEVAKSTVKVPAVVAKPSVIATKPSVTATIPTIMTPRPEKVAVAPVKEIAPVANVVAITKSETKKELTKEAKITKITRETTRVSAPASTRITKKITPIKSSNAGMTSMSGNLLPMPKLGTFDVAFNGSIINFDVAPRIENGLPLAPFRQIFEHSGGKVEWFSKTHTVRATNSHQEVIIKVGEKTATVNGQMMGLDRASFIEKGRTIVPISFVGQALDVDINFDPVTGRLQINSK